MKKTKIIKVKPSKKKKLKTYTYKKGYLHVNIPTGKDTQKLDKIFEIENIGNQIATSCFQKPIRYRLYHRQKGSKNSLKEHSLREKKKVNPMGK